MRRLSKKIGKLLRQERTEGLGLQRVQRRATRMIADFGHLSYHERFARLCIFSSCCRRMRGDMTEVFKIIKGLARIDPNILFVRNVNTVMKIADMYLNCITRDFRSSSGSDFFVIE